MSYPLGHSGSGQRIISGDTGSTTGLCGMQTNSIHSSANLSSATGGVGRYESKLFLDGVLTPPVVVVVFVVRCDVWNIEDIFGSDFLVALSLIIKPGGHEGTGQVLIIAERTSNIEYHDLQCEDSYATY